MCSKCNKMHAAGVAACERSANDILASLDAGMRSTLDAVNVVKGENVKLLERIEAMEKAGKHRAAPVVGKKVQLRGVSLPGVEDEKEQFSFARLVIALREHRPELAPFEMDVCKQSNRLSNRPLGDDGAIDYSQDGERDLSTDLDTAGGYLVPAQVSAQLIELFRANLITGKLGVTRMDGLTGGAFQIGKQTGTCTVYDVSEAESITKSQQAVGLVEMRPRELAALTVVSNRLLRLSNPSAEGMVRDDLVMGIDLAQDLRILQGTGLKQPLGIVNTPGVTVKTFGAALTIDQLYEMIYAVEAANAAKGRLGFAFAPRTWNKLRQLKDGEGRYILTTNGTSSGPQQNPSISGTLLGYPFYTTTQIPITLGSGAASRIYFGNWSDVVLANWFNLEIAASKETSTAFAQNQTWIRALTEYDLMLKHGPSFCVDSTIL